jgi:hypothetical protein
MAPRQKRGFFIPAPARFRGAGRDLSSSIFVVTPCRHKSLTFHSYSASKKSSSRSATMFVYKPHFITLSESAQGPDFRQPFLDPPWVRFSYSSSVNVRVFSF